MTKRGLVRITSFAVFFLAILATFSIVNTRNMNIYKRQLEINYQQSLTELSECLDSIETNLTKSVYSNSSTELYDVSRNLYSECSTAKNAISRLPINQLNLNNTYKFLSQASDYALYISQKLENGEAITDEEHKNITTLLDYAQKFSQSASSMVKTTQSGGLITENQVANATSALTVSSLSNSFSTSEEAFTDYPTLLYDGPFSDQILNKESQLLSKKESVDKQTAQTIAGNAINVASSKMTYKTVESSSAECYSFACGRYTVLVTQRGGLVKSIIYSGVISESTITQENAINIAKDYLNSLGYSNMQASYYTVNNNVLTANFVYVKDNVYYYSDLIKVSISLSDGTPLELDATTYIMNHKSRKSFSSKITEKQAKSKVSKYLTVNSVKKCVIPKDNGTEVNCYEFSCTSKETGDDALIYINSATGSEEDIMLLLYSDNGTLVK